MAQATLSCRYAAIHLVYLGIYTREEKMCPQGAVFLQYSLESVVSSSLKGVETLPFFFVPAFDFMRGLCYTDSRNTTAGKQEVS